MTDAVPRPMLHCKMCGHNWRPLMASRVPRNCSYCGSSFWQTGKYAEQEEPVEAPEPEPPAPDPHQPLRDLAKQEYAAFLSRRSLQDQQAREEYREKRGQRRYAPHEVEIADVRPPVLQTGVPFTLAKLTLTRRSRRRRVSE